MTARYFVRGSLSGAFASFRKLASYVIRKTAGRLKITSCLVCAYTFVFVLVHSHYTVFKVHMRRSFRSERGNLASRVCWLLSRKLRLSSSPRDSFDIIALLPSFVNTFFRTFLPFLYMPPSPRFSLSPPIFFRPLFLPFQTSVPYIFKSI